MYNITYKKDGTHYLATETYFLTYEEALEHALDLEAMFAQSALEFHEMYNCEFHIFQDFEQNDYK